VGGESPGRAKIPTSPQATPSPSSPPTSSGFPVLFCRLYFTATSGVCLFPLQAPLLFPYGYFFLCLPFKKTTFAIQQNRPDFVLDFLGRLAIGRSRSISKVDLCLAFDGARAGSVCGLRTADRWSVCLFGRCAPEHRY
jgi:hypothetical protein